VACEVIQEDILISIKSALPRLKEFIERQTPTLNAPRIALGLTHREHFLQEGAYKLANREARPPVTPKLLFQIGSISNFFTSIAMLLIQEHGLLRIDGSRSPEFIRCDVIIDGKAMQAILPGGVYRQTLTL
jgi:hypothetical protein